MWLTGVLTSAVFALTANAVEISSTSSSNASAGVPYLPSIYASDADTNLTSWDNATWASEAIYKACKGAGTDEHALIDILGPMEPQTRYRVTPRFRSLYNKTLKNVLKDETSGWFSDLLGKIVVSLPELEHDIMWHVRGAVNSETGIHLTQYELIPLFVGRSQAEIKTLKQTYEKLENKDFVKTVKSLMEYNLPKVILPWINDEIPHFDPAVHTMEKAKEDADKLYQAGEAHAGTDEKTFIKICMESPHEHLQNISSIYEEKHHHSIVHAIHAEFSSFIEDALVFHVRVMLEDPMDALAHHFYSSMEGPGTNERALNNALVRYYHFLPQINDAYERLYDASLRARIDDETSGYYRKLLLRIFDSAIPYTPPPPKSHRTLNIVLISIGASIVVVGVLVVVLTVMKKKEYCCWRPRPRPAEAAPGDYKSMMDAAHSKEAALNTQSTGLVAPQTSDRAT